MVTRSRVDSELFSNLIVIIGIKWVFTANTAKQKLVRLRYL